MEKPQSNPDYRPLDFSIQRDYIRSAEERYQEHKEHKYKWWLYRGGDYWHDHHGVGYREQMKFKCKPHHKKKTVSLEENQKRDWKEKKRTHYHFHARKKYYRQKGNRAERRRVKIILQQDDWNNYLKGRIWYQRHWSESAGNWANYTHPRKREFVNPWDWD